MNTNDNLTEYLELARTRPEDFQNPSDCPLPISLDINEMAAYQNITGKMLGILADNSPYFYLVGDLICTPKAQYRYCRIIYKRKSNGGVCLIHLKESNKFCLLKIFRHANRKISLEFPRGFHHDDQQSVSENMRKELSEEIGIAAEKVQVKQLGYCESDSSIINGKVAVFCAEVETVSVNVGEEGILGYEVLTENELLSKLGTEITDNFTITAYTLWKKTELLKTLNF